jgi:hypothetical protein
MAIGVSDLTVNLNELDFPLITDSLVKVNSVIAPEIDI